MVYKNRKLYELFFSMRFIIAIITVMIISLLASSCNKGASREEMLAKERNALKEILDSKQVKAYRGIKIILRSLAENQNSDDFPELTDDEQEALDGMKELGTLLLDRLYSISSTEEPTGIGDYLSLFTSFNKFLKYTDQIDEDRFPTLVDLVVGVLNEASEDHSISASQFGWNSDIEHLTLALLFEVYKVDEGISLYELSKISYTQSMDCGLKVCSSWLTAYYYHSNELNYLAEESLTRAIEIAEESKDNCIDIESVNGIQGITTNEMLSFSYYFRGVIRCEIGHEMKEDGLDDFETCYALLENEEHSQDLRELAMISSLVYQGEYAEAADRLSKLSDNTIEAADGDYNQPDIYTHAFNSLVGKRVVEGIQETKIYNDVKESPAGEKIWAMPQKYKEIEEQIEQYTSVEKMLDEGKNLMDKFIH